MNFRLIITLGLLVYIVLGSVVLAQPVHFPDPNLRNAIIEQSNVNPDRITVVALRRLTRLDAPSREIENLEGLQHAPNLRLLDLSDNHISDLTPLANLTNLKELLLGENRISDLTPLANLRNLDILILNGNDITDISPLGRLTNLWVLKMPYNAISNLTPLANLTKLEELLLHGNRISDISPLGRLTNLRFLKMPYNGISDLEPLANLTKLEELVLNGNRISDISPLAGLTNLKVLKIEDNPIIDHSILDHLSIEALYYDQTCDISPMPVRPRLANRTFPSVWANWGATLNLPHLTNMEITALHDFYGSGLKHGHRFFYNGTQWEIRSGSSLARTEPDPRRIFDLNPNMIFLAEVRLKNSGGSIPSDFFPDDHPYWLRDASGAIAIESGRRLINFAHPDVQDIIVGQALAVAKCGLYDGIFFDWWNDFASTVGDLISLEDAVAARENIVRRIRAETRSDFLITGNTNDRIIPITAHYLNGGWMEADLPGTEDRREHEMREARDALQWLETNLREPRINLLQIGSDDSESPDSDYNQQLMRATTTMSLTHSDGYVQFSIGTGDDHYWYDFWDADLGRPVGPKFQLYENIEGLYIREFTNGWAVYNQSGEAQVVTLPEEVQGVASGLVNTEHALPNLDGEMYLRVKPVNPADVNRDGIVNILDLTIVAQGLGTDNLKGDVNGDGFVNILDLVFVADQF